MGVEVLAGLEFAAAERDQCERDSLQVGSQLLLLFCSQLKSRRDVIVSRLSSTLTRLVGLWFQDDPHHSLIPSFALNSTALTKFSDSFVDYIIVQAALSSQFYCRNTRVGSNETQNFLLCFLLLVR